MSILVNSPSLSKSNFMAEARALGAIFKREWTIFLRYPTWIIAMIVWPVIFPAMYILSARALAGPDGDGLTQFLKAAGTDNFLGYIVIGTTVWMWQNIVLWNVGFALREEQWRGTLESNWVSPTFRFSFLIGSSLAQMISVLTFLIVTLIEFTVFFGLRLEGSLWLGLLVIVAAIPAIYGLGFAFASLVITAKEAHNFVFLVRGTVMIFCGITFPVSLLPGWMQGIASWLPQTYVMNAMRTALLKTGGLPALLPDLKMLAIFGLFWLAAGYSLFLWMDHRARKTGAIGQF